uniref:ARM repeat superfamily protein n=1 Tax=Juniperus phoenicea TaxID=61308 RepID=A0A3S6N4A5_9CONI|nr:ARM repeat superfamily protein [Juniperus phoenicea]
MSQSLELLLIQFLMPDNDARRQAEEQIKRLAKDPQVVPALLQHIRTAKAANVRQLAAVLLRKKITGHWMKLSPQLRDSVKAALIESITGEHSPPVRRASANVVSVVAKYAVPAGEWPDLLPFLFQCSQSVQEDHREVALILFSSLTETIGDVLRPHFSTLQSVFVKSLQDESSNRVRIAALKAVGSFVEYIQTDNEVLMFRELIPSILNVSRQCLANGDEEVATIAFEIFDDLVESPAPVLGSSILPIVQFALEVCSRKDLEASTRHQAIQIISWLAKYKPKALIKHKLVNPILAAMCPLLAEGNKRDEDDDLSSDRAAAEVLDTMAMSLPRKHIFPPVLNFASLNSQNMDPRYREASVMSLGVISEGCFDVMKNKMENILTIVLQALKDPEQIVRGAASFALGQFAEHLQPEIVTHYEIVLPCILNALGDTSPDVQEKAYYALAAFCENMGSEILPYLEPLMGKLLEGLHSNRRDLQETCMSAIGSAAAAAELAFIPYAESVLELMKIFMVFSKDEDLRARARATELVGIIAMAVGRPRMEPILAPFIEAAIAGFALDFSEVREYTHGFFSNIAEVLDDGFIQYLHRVVPLAFASCNLDDGSAVDIDDSDDDGAARVFGGVSSDEEAQDDRRVRNISVRTGVLDEKAAATQAIGLFALHTKSAFTPYFEEALKILTKHVGYFHEDVRLQAIIGLQHLLTATQETFPSSNQLSPETKHVLDTVMNLYLRAMQEDDDKEVVSQACMCTAEIMKSFGFNAIEPYMASLSKATLELLRQEACCQQTDETDSDLDDDDSEHDEVLMDAVTDLLPAFAKCMGSRFEAIFGSFFEPLMKFAKASRPPEDRTMVVACLAEVAQEMGSPIAHYMDIVMPLVIKEISSTEAANRRNAAFCAGELCKNGGEAALKYYNDVLCALHPLFGDLETDDAVRDNAAGAVARLIMAQPHAVPLNQVLPVFLKALPLKDDLEESLAVYGCLCNLIMSSKPEILSLIPQVVQIFAQVVASPAESSQVKAGISMGFSHLLSQYGDQMQPILNSLSPQHSNALASLIARS